MLHTISPYELELAAARRREDFPHTSRTRRTAPPRRRPQASVFVDLLLAGVPGIR